MYIIIAGIYVYELYTLFLIDELFYNFAEIRIHFTNITQIYAAMIKMCGNVRHLVKCAVLVRK